VKTYPNRASLLKGAGEAAAAQGQGPLADLPTGMGPSPAALRGWGVKLWRNGFLLLSCKPPKINGPANLHVDRF